ncbi:MAG TPA: hypothetical protein PLX14_06450 [Anaerolineales bacterium]|nr:hypothetical protein [Anaerolineales bacterium]HNC08326.1 hypothetical protein [Anaerolineales bacterium]
MTYQSSNTNWQEYLCDDLRPVMQYLQEKHFITGWRVDHDLHQRWTRIYLTRNLSPKILSNLRDRFANSPQVQILVNFAEVRCSDHQIHLVSRRQWVRQHGIKGQSLISLLFDMGVLLLFVAGGFFLIFLGDEKGNTRDILVGIGSILFFGLAFAMNLNDLIQHYRKKK